MPSSQQQVHFRHVLQKKSLICYRLGKVALFWLLAIFLLNVELFATHWRRFGWKSAVCASLWRRHWEFFLGIYENLRNDLIDNGVLIPSHSLHQVVRQLSNSLYNEPEEQNIAYGIAVDVQHERSSTTANVHVAVRTKEDLFQINAPKRRP